ncbi:MAG: hypothetical protein DMF56_23030 [Acidobacteria bacterium]|nr:MAG: hypothetical protein DMF56_23030 [Acidobacteriota bacterium]
MALFGAETWFDRTILDSMTHLIGTMQAWHFTSISSRKKAVKDLKTRNLRFFATLRMTGFQSDGM